MSTLKVATIQDTSGNNSSTPEQVAQGRAKAWINFNGKSSITINDDFNISSISDNGTGKYTVNFTTAMSNANYAVDPGAMISNRGDVEVIPNRDCSSAVKIDPRFAELTNLRARAVLKRWSTTPRVLYVGCLNRAHVRPPSKWRQNLPLL